VALRLNDPKTMESIWERNREVFWTHYPKTRTCWETQIAILHDRLALARDKLTYREYTHKAEIALRLEDLETCQIFVFRAYELLPDSEKLKNQYFDASLRR